MDARPVLVCPLFVVTFIAVFYHLTYEGAVDIENITDPTERDSLEAQINEFGQCPKKLFDDPHPAKLPKVCTATRALT